jgi:transposase
MTAIGIDTHKATLAACAIDELGRPIGEATFANDPAGHDAFIAWARSTAPEATVGIEGSSSFGAPLARSVQGAGLCVREVPPHLSRAERRRTRRPGKSDPGDALAIARVTARETNLPPIRLSDRTSDLHLLLEAREDLIGEATRARNRLHAHLLVLAPGYGGTVTNLVAASAARSLAPAPGGCSASTRASILSVFAARGSSPRTRWALAISTSQPANSRWSFGEPVGG